MVKHNPLGVLMLENGEIFGGVSVGARGSFCGEIVFNTSMSGYQEILTDPSYYQQIVAMTYPEIGNYGVCDDEAESDKVHCKGFLVRKLQPYAYPPGFVGQGNRYSLGDYLKKNNVVALEGIDTRRLVRLLRDKGAMRGIISDEQLPLKKLQEMLQNQPSYEEINMVEKVSCKEAYDFVGKNTQKHSEKWRIGVIDYGTKRNILRILDSKGAKVRVYPSNVSLQELLADKIEGVVLSNGPGNPKNCVKEVKTVKQIIGKIPIFGICLGHQILVIANGYTTYKLPFGHHGSNHPIKTAGQTKVDITSQNHGYAVEKKGHSEIFPHTNLNDETIAGFVDKEKNCFSVQYHPEGAPGPRDSFYLFDQFLQTVRLSRTRQNQI